MSLPITFQNTEDYFEECVSFFQEYQHLYNFANTEILVKNVLERFNISNLENDVFAKTFNVLLEVKHSTFLKDFFAQINKFKVFYEDFLEDDEFENTTYVPLSPKKRHEVVYLAKEIAGVCAETQCQTVVDLGSGLGYLDQMLFKKAGLRVLGLECKESNYVGAKKRQRKYHDYSIEKVKYIKHMVTDNSDGKIEEYLQDKFGSHDGFCITGLHTCADLTVDAVNLFLKMDDAKSMVLMPCCYHKMRKQPSDNERFMNFPLSKCLKDIFEKYQGSNFMRVPFLRLAAQPPSITEDNLEDLVFNLLARAVLQMYAEKHNSKLKRNKRKAVKINTMDNNFANYIQDATGNGFTLTSEVECIKDNKAEPKDRNKDFDIEELTSMWRDITQHTFKKAAIFVLLQNHLQPVIENFVLYDRLVYLREKGVDRCRCKRIFNEKVSPRCLCLLAFK